MKKKPITPDNMEVLAEKIMKLLVEKELFTEINLYVNKKRYSSNPIEKDSKKVTKTWGDYYEKKNVDVSDILEYFNQDTVTMTFEGPLYHSINHGDGKIIDELNKLADVYDLYLEQGYAWSLAFYK